MSNRLTLRTWAGIMNHLPERRHEWTMAYGTLAMAFALTIQPQMFETGRHYATLDKWASEEFFAWVFLSLGVLRLAALIVNGTFSSFEYSPHLRVITAALAAFTWGAFSYSFLHTYEVTVRDPALRDTSIGPCVVYAICASIEVANVRAAAESVGKRWRDRAR